MDKLNDILMAKTVSTPHGSDLLMSPKTDESFDTNRAFIKTNASSNSDSNLSN